MSQHRHALGAAPHGQQPVRRLWQQPERQQRQEDGNAAEAHQVAPAQRLEDAPRQAIDEDGADGPEVLEEDEAAPPVVRLHQLGEDVKDDREAADAHPDEQPQRRERLERLRERRTQPHHGDEHPCRHRHPPPSEAVRQRPARHGAHHLPAKHRGRQHRPLPLAEPKLLRRRDLQE